MHSDKDLAKFSEHVLYEMAMLVGIPKRLEAAADDVTKNGLLESFAIHARQLVDFFYDHGEPGEIGASDYFNEPIPEWKMIRGKEDSVLKDMVKRVSEEIAHLTLRRTQPKEVWNLVGIVKEIEGRCVRFVDGVHSAKISGPDKGRFLSMLREHNDWVATCPVVIVDGLTTVHSTIVSSGFIGTGKTSPPDDA